MTDGLARVDARLADIKAREAAGFLASTKLREGYVLLFGAAVRALEAGGVLLEGEAERMTDRLDDAVHEAVAWRREVKTVRRRARSRNERERLEAAVGE